MAGLRYAIIALKKNEVDALVGKLKDSPFEQIGDWLRDQKEVFYGDGNEDWKPFNGKSIDTLINERLIDEPKGRYSNGTNLLYDFRQDKENYGVVAPIRVYFIDAFALFLDNYYELVFKNDSLMAEKNFCCLVISNDWPKDIQERALQRYRKALSVVCTKYREGQFHRIAMREDDLRNFRNYLANTIGKADLPAVAKEAQMQERYPYETDKVPG